MAPDVTPSTADGRTALCPGTYDPVTYGHLDIIERAAGMFDRIVVGVVRHPDAQGAVLHDRASGSSSWRRCWHPSRTWWWQGSRRSSSNTRGRGGRCALVKGLRAVSDFEWELQMAHLNKRIAPEIETVFLMSSPRYSFLSSSGVRELAAFGGPIADFVPPVVAEAFARRTL